MSTGIPKGSFTWYLGFFNIHGKKNTPSKTVNITPPSIANPPPLKSQKLLHPHPLLLASPIQKDQNLAPIIDVGIPNTQYQ
jgi:hypothetical protein